MLAGTVKGLIEGLSKLYDDPEFWDALTSEQEMRVRDEMVFLIDEVLPTARKAAEQEETAYCAKDDYTVNRSY